MDKFLDKLVDIVNDDNFAIWIVNGALLVLSVCMTLELVIW